MSLKRPRPEWRATLEIINRHNQHNPRQLFRRKVRKPVPMRNKPGWFYDRRVA